ncbi:MAG: Asp23/Gls24 family envelope stress response protein [Clostridiales bacterium]|nr:Asp23/Gls24 family envelope stress response protein [Clostridiales bacterium]
MDVYALIGKSGSGKSYKAQNVARDYGIEYIIDDGLLIKGNKVIAGISAKKEETKFAAVRRAVFFDPAHKKEMTDAINLYKPASILIIGTSAHMIDRIVKNLNLPATYRKIYIRDISTPAEINTALKTRREQGKHAIPVPTFAIKRDFSGYFIDSIKNFTRRGNRVDMEDIEKTVVRPTYSYLGKYTISNNAIKSIVIHAGMDAENSYRVNKVNVQNTDNGLKIDMDISVTYGIIIPDIVKRIRERIKLEVEHMTAFNVLAINIFVKNIDMKSSDR